MSVFGSFPPFKLNFNVFFQLINCVGYYFQNSFNALVSMFGRPIIIEKKLAVNPAFCCSACSITYFRVMPVFPICCVISSGCIGSVSHTESISNCMCWRSSASMGELRNTWLDIASRCQLNCWTIASSICFFKTALCTD